MSKNVVIAVVAVLVLAALGWFLTQPKMTLPPVSQTPTSQESAAPTASSEAQMSENMVSITSLAFSPKTISIKVGESVTWENTDSADHTVNSAPHPTHTLYPFLNVGRLSTGEKKSVMFEKSGTYTYHDHLNPSLTGTVTVQ